MGTDPPFTREPDKFVVARLEKERVVWLIERKADQSVRMYIPTLIPCVINNLHKPLHRPPDAPHNSAR
jgi:hypothetical protein